MILFSGRKAQIKNSGEMRMFYEPSVVVAGHICLDIIPDIVDNDMEDGEQMLLPGRLTEVGPATLSTGGSVSNTGLALYKLGINTRLMGKVGDDMFGKAIIKLLNSYDESLAKGMILDNKVNTSYSLVINPPGIDRILFHCPGANDTFTAQDIDYSKLKNTTLFHFGYPPLMKKMYEDEGEQLSEIFQLVKSKSITTSLDMALPDPSSPGGKANWKKILQKTLHYVDIFFPSIEEIIYMLRRDVYNKLNIANEGSAFLSKLQPDILKDLSLEILDMGAKIVGLKLGKKGFYLKTAGESKIVSLGNAVPTNPVSWACKELWAPCFKVNVVGTAGSGDATIAGFLSGFLRGMSPEEATISAVAVGACNVEKVDTLSGIRSWSETMNRVSSEWAMHELDINAPGWHYIEDYKLWAFDMTIQ